MSKRIKESWTIERREKMAKIIHQWKPWLKAGVKTSAGKEISKMNAVKHGGRSSIIRVIRDSLNTFI